MASVVQVRTDQGIGTGFLARQQDGRAFFVTNEHVVRGAASVAVVAPDGTMHDALVHAEDDTVDLALLVVEGVTGMPPVRWGDVAALRVGDPLYVVGFALGDELLGDPTVTRGVLSGRRMYGQVDYIQTDAAMNPGNSGGPVVSGSGEVVGVATWVLRELGGVPIEGINFAIPADVVVDFIDRSL
ncbi:MAG: trypsin-like peptidase domain-containing protein [Sphaerobacter sp.]|nr:trypsin-like peptidase domain-containing protein [Sphaerobacter sp.]